MIFNKTCYFLFLVSISSVTLFGMDNATYVGVAENGDQLPVITRPYSPAFADRYPVVWGLIKTGMCTTAAYCLASCQETVPTCGIVAGGLVVGGTMSAVSYARNKYRFLNSLLLNPIAACNTIYKTHAAYGQALDRKVKEENLSSDEAQQRAVPIVLKLINSYEKICPVYFLGECVREDWWYCVLSRRFEPLYRESFEQNVVKTLLACLDSKAERPVQYVGFGCGGAFQDFVIAVKTLAQKPDASLAIHLIDRKYTPCVACLGLLSDSHQIVPKIPIDYYRIMPLVKQRYKDEWGAKDLPDVQFENAVIGESIRIEVRAKQFVSFLQKTFPRAHVELFLHSDKQDYLEYIEKHGSRYADVISAADIQDEMSLLTRGPLDYGLLCQRVLQQNPESRNYWLSRWQNVTIEQLSLTESTNSKREKFDNVDLYVSSEILKPSTGKLKRMLMALKYPNVC